MRKRDELADPQSCLNKARDEEMLFVLLGRDEDAPDTIIDWVRRRIASGKNKPLDPKIQEALQCALTMERERHERKTTTDHPPALPADHH